MSLHGNGRFLIFFRLGMEMRSCHASILFWESLDGYLCVRSGVVRLLLSYTTLFFDILFVKEEDLMNGKGSLQ